MSQITKIKEGTPVTTPDGTLVDQNLATGPIVATGVKYEKRPARTPDGEPVEGLFNAWITLDNPKQFNSYTTEMVKGVILAFRTASNARDVVSVVFTGVGDRAFCTGGTPHE